MFDWSHYLDLARNLVGETDIKPSDEAKARTSISRSYYCIYHAAREYLKEEGDTNIGQKMEDSHIYVIEQLRNRPERKLSQIGNNLYRLKDDRVRADYEGDIKILLKEAEKVLRLASWLKAQLENEVKLLRLKSGKL